MVMQAVKTDVQKSIDILVENALTALSEYMELSQEQVDKITQEMALAGLDSHMRLAKMAVEETGRGVLEDKAIKNMFATEYIYHSIKYEKTVGIVNENEHEDYYEVIEPVGVIAGVTPVTNPTSTTMFKSIIAAKTRNPIIFAFHPSAQKCSAESARILRDAAVKAGAPKHCIQWIETPSVEATRALMAHPGVFLILATGGTGMVRSAYSCGKPALGVGPGNVPCFIEKTAKLERAVTDLIMSKSFDNGMICASEQAVIIEQPVYRQAVEYMKEHNCYFTTPEETRKIEAAVMNAETCAVNPDIVGKSPQYIAKKAGIEIPAGTKIICCEIGGVGREYPLSYEKLSPVLAVIKARDAEHGIRLSEKMVEIGGLGHSSVIHSSDENVIEEFSRRMKTGRVIINSPSTHGAIGDIYNTNMPSLTLGCGTYGSNSTTSNVTAVNLINRKRVAKRRVNMQWFKIPEKIYFESGCLQYLEKMPDISRAFIVTDPQMVKLGYVDRVLYYLRKRKSYVHSEIFTDVEPDPSLDTVQKGAKMMDSFKPDVIIALGGGSAIDAAKGMWLFYEHPETDFEGLAEKFMDIRKRVYKLPRMGSKAKLVAIPTTSGTGSEVTSFAVITDRERNIKYPLADYELTPDVAIVDPDFVMTVPPSVTADTGMDVLTHAIEAYVSVLASDYTDALAIKAIKMVFEYLPIAYKDGSNKLAREKMHNASTIAGMAFTNAFLGINHSLAHKLGGEFNIPHGRANAILLPHVIEYNGVKSPTKFVSFPKYERYIAAEKYAEIARELGLEFGTAEEGAKALAGAVRELMKKMNIPLTLKACGIEEEKFLEKVDYLAIKAFEDQCTTANPRLPLVSELAGLYKKAYYGE
ncbi:MAG TPA: bifunctional acetaldehyde-CoA/alcohol dehydrogenase [Candidatus Avimonas sp.]|jgi:acetaldehyde dehydrogenase/alcohol dehydrogenase|nr:bifunctional acetaldehyde-CoA/alcohol dehydrogenase [Clostridiales bacterium]HOB36698.1 bifunctional acetaldehyde-CoA/alcohol dehydrogenase [Candidatus Avimonas sp.]HQA15926.1 bifunctional acetaldehyde-CoA/alcohol dehydrogenase [Candidatus Avimonas sp.]HQD37699.1 bifunctional acetaldehyde-CoA/alcohol dehydrogenase [Candidatus Avimonas sp.]